MLIKKIGKLRIITLLASFLVLAILVAPSLTLAVNSGPCHPENNNPPGTALSPEDLKNCLDCNGHPNPTPESLNECLNGNPIVRDLNKIVNFLSAGVGIVVIGMIILGGIQYMAAGDKVEAITSAKKRITNALIALLAFIFMFAFLQWVVPGGIF